MRLTALILVAGVILMIDAFAAEATLSMLMRGMRASQPRYGSMDGYGDAYSSTTPKPPTLGSIIGSAIDGIATLKGMVMTPMIDMAATLMMMANKKATTPAPTYAPPAPSYAPPASTYAAPYYGSLVPIYPADLYSNGYSGYYTTSDGSAGYLAGSTPDFSLDYPNGLYSRGEPAAVSSKDFYASSGKYGTMRAKPPSSTVNSKVSNKVKRYSSDIYSAMSWPSTSSVRYDANSAGAITMVGNGVRWQINPNRPRRRSSYYERS